MAWKCAASGEMYDGETHELAGVTYTGKTRTADSQRLVWVKTPEPTSLPQPKPTRKKASVSKRAKSK